jgi:hypothetical protein
MANSLESLHNKIDLLECHLRYQILFFGKFVSESLVFYSAAELLEKHNLPKTVAFVKETQVCVCLYWIISLLIHVFNFFFLQYDEEKTKELFVKLTRIAGKKWGIFAS